MLLRDAIEDLGLIPDDDRTEDLAPQGAQVEEWEIAAMHREHRSSEGACVRATALPEYFGATDGITTDGTPVGNLAYATTCFVVAGVVVYNVSTFASTKHAAPATDHALR